MVRIVSFSNGRNGVAATTLADTRDRMWEPDDVRIEDQTPLESEWVPCAVVVGQQPQRIEFKGV